MPPGHSVCLYPTHITATKNGVNRKKKERAFLPHISNLNLQNS